MHDLSETPNFDAAVTVPDDGVDYRTAVSLSTKALQQLTNRTRWLKNLLIGAVTTPVIINQLSAGTLGAGNTLIDGTLQVNESASLLQSVTIGNDLTIADKLQANGEATFNGLTHLNASVDAQSISCTDLFTDGTTTIGTNSLQTCTVEAKAFFNNAVRCSDSLTVTALFTASRVSLRDILTCSTGGRIVRPVKFGAASGGGTLDPVLGTTWYFQTCTSPQIYTLSNVSENGDELEVVCDVLANAIKIQKPGGIDFSPTLYLARTSGNVSYARFKCVLGQWIELTRTITP